MKADPVLDDRAAGLTDPPVAILLAGGRGSRLFELTDRTCKPALPFVRRRRIVDFTMENIARAGMRKVIVASQFRAEPLETHLHSAWGRRFGSAGLAFRRGSDLAGAALRYGGTADAVWKNAAEIAALGAREVMILSADHIYEMDYGPMIAAHRASGARITLAATVVGRHDARGFGVIGAAPGGQITDFTEKPDEPQTLPGDPEHALASMGIYLCDWVWLRRMLAEDALCCRSTLDFGHDINKKKLVRKLSPTFLPI